MPKRLAILLILLFVPFAASADDVAPTPSPNAAADLGPQTSSSSPLGSSGGSKADTGSLQPAGTSPLQSVTSDSTGLTAPSNLLQGSVPNGDTLKVLASEADGAPHATSGETTGSWTWPITLLMIFLIVAAGSVVVRDRRRFQNINP
jgi:hypothetical protein